MPKSKPALRYPLHMSKIVLWVSDMDAQAAFYSRLLGLEQVIREPGFAELSSETNSVLLHELPEKYRGTVPLTAQLTAQQEVVIKPVFVVTDIAAARKSINDTFGTVQGSEKTYGVFTYLDVVDPEGNVIQLEQRAN
jgi:catechol 2,3-dioxygenase-like lactoylglutathione lyase family enzyme